MKRDKYILWDWNGTLLDDTEAALETLNDMLVLRGQKPIRMDFYRDNFSFPVKPFYAAIGMAIPDEDWDALALEYHQRYAAKPTKLTAGALEALARVKASGARQSIVSALRQDLLEKATVAFGVRPYMQHVWGVDNLDGASKRDRAIAVVENLVAEGVARENIVFIGDALHDKEVADATGARCVLCATGSHAGWRLRAVARTADTLLDAVALALD